MPDFACGSIVTLAAFTVYCLGPSAWLFVAATATLGFIGIFMNPFLMPMSIEADPSRRAAVQGGAAELLGLALGPLLASRVVSENDVYGALLLGAILILTGVAIMAILHFTARQMVVPAETTAA
jgi:MFS family permease